MGETIVRMKFGHHLAYLNITCQLEESLMDTCYYRLPQCKLVSNSLGTFRLIQTEREREREEGRKSYESSNQLCHYTIYYVPVIEDEILQSK